MSQSIRQLPIEAVIFDMDGLLIDSEPLWVQAEREVFRRVGLTLSVEDCSHTKGLCIDEVVSFWHELHPWSNLTLEEVGQGVVDRVCELVRLHGELRPGAQEALDFFTEKKLPMALASSSHEILIKTTMEALGIADRFAFHCSAEHEEFGKPHPAIYLTAAKKLGVAAQNCLALEDSLNGVIAAKAARMRCIAIPEPFEREDPRFTIADCILRTGADLNDRLWELQFSTK